MLPLRDRQKPNPNTRRATYCAIALFVLAGFLRLPERFGPPLVQAALFVTINLIYIGLAIFWSVSIRQRLQQSSVRRFLLAVCALMVFWICLRACKYRYFQPFDALTRYFWYSYYISLLFGPVCGLLAVLCLGHPEVYRPSKACWLLFVPAAVLCALILTNDLHQLAFRFQPGFRNWDNEYTHGIIYFISVIFLAAIMIASFCVLYKKCKSADGKRRFGIPVLIFTAGLCLCLLSFLNAFWIYKIPELFCVTYAATWEACIQAGLVPTNINYKGFFSVSTIAARINDAGGGTRYSAQGADMLSKQDMRRAQESPVMLNADTRLQAHPINGGYVYWLSNVSTIKRMNDELAEKRALLTEAVEIARAENEIKAQKAQIEEQNRVYDRIALIARPQLKQLDALLTAWKAEGLEHRQKLKTACILGAYIKRRLNLQLIAEGAAGMQTEELYYCLRESAEYLSIGGTLCKCVQDGSGMISSGAILLAYDFFQAAIEAALPSLSTLLIRCGLHDKFLELRLVMEDTANTVAQDWHKQELAQRKASLDCQMSDGTLFYTLRIPKEGDAL